MADIEADRELLVSALESDDLSDVQKYIVDDMYRRLDRGNRPLTDKQRAFVKAMIAKERSEPEPEYKNLVSSGLVPRGREVATIDLLKPENLPKRPPPRKVGT